MARTPDPLTWLESHGDAMFAYAVRRLGRRDLAEDAVQEALLGALASVGGYESRSSERTWLIGILRYKVLDAVRGLARDRAVQSGVDAEDCSEFVDGSFAVHQEDWDLAPGGAISGEDLRAALLRGIGDLPDAMRLAVCFKEIDGMDAGSIAEALGVSREHVWTLVHRGKSRLRRHLRDESGRSGRSTAGGPGAYKGEP